jgi:hypothetical protein
LRNHDPSSVTGLNLPIPRCAVHAHATPRVASWLAVDNVCDFARFPTLRWENPLA